MHLQMKLQQFNINDGGPQMEVLVPKMDKAITQVMEHFPDVTFNYQDAAVRSCSNVCSAAAGSPHSEDGSLF